MFLLILTILLIVKTITKFYLKQDFQFKQENQVEKFGQHFFKEGSMVIPGGTSYDSEYFAVKIDPNFLNIPVSNYTKVLVDNKIKIQGETSGV